MTDTLIYLFFAATALEFLFALWLNRLAQSVLDAFIANLQLHEAAGRPSDLISCGTFTGCATALPVS